MVVARALLPAGRPEVTRSRFCADITLFRSLSPHHCLAACIALLNNSGRLYVQPFFLTATSCSSFAIVILYTCCYCVAFSLPKHRSKIVAKFWRVLKSPVAHERLSYHLVRNRPFPPFQADAVGAAPSFVTRSENNVHALAVASDQCNFKLQRL